MCTFLQCWLFLLQNRLNQKVRLSGYGVELQMKSTEYKAEDDSLRQEQKTETTAAEDEDLEVDGFNFNTLKYADSCFINV